MQIMLIVFFAIHLAPPCRAESSLPDAKGTRLNRTYESIYMAYDSGKMYPEFSCDEKKPFAVVEFHEDENELARHKKGDPFYLITHSGELAEAVLVRLPHGPQDPNCKTIVDQRLVDGTTMQHHYGVLKLKGEIKWSEGWDCYGNDAVMAVKGDKPKSSDIGMVYEAVDDFESSSTTTAKGDPRTWELALKARPQIIAFIQKDLFKTGYYQNGMHGITYRIVSPDRKHEFLFENLSGAADGAESFVFRVDPSGPKLLRHEDTYSCIFNVTNFDQGGNFEILENLFQHRLTSNEVLYKFDPLKRGRTIRTFGFMIGD